MNVVNVSARSLIKLNIFIVKLIIVLNRNVYCLSFIRLLKTIKFHYNNYDLTLRGDIVQTKKLVPALRHPHKVLDLELHPLPKPFKILEAKA